VVQAEQFAKAKMQVYNTMSNIWNEILDVKNVMFGNNEGLIHSPAPYYSNDLLLSMGQSTSFVASTIEYNKGKSNLTPFELKFIKAGNTIDKFSTVTDFVNLIQDPTSDNLVDFGLDLAGYKSLPLWWYSTWALKVAPYAIEETNREGYKSLDYRQLSEDQRLIESLLFK